MFTSLLTAYSRVVAAIAAPRDENEKGQGTLEYVGIVVIAALLVTAIFTAVKGADIGSTITSKLKEITGIGG